MTYSDLVAAINHLRATNRICSAELMRLRERSGVSALSWNLAMKGARASATGYAMAA